MNIAYFKTPINTVSPKEVLAKNVCSEPNGGETDHLEHGTCYKRQATFLPHQSYIFLCLLSFSGCGYILYKSHKLGLRLAYIEFTALDGADTSPPAVSICTAQTGWTDRQCTNGRRAVTDPIRDFGKQGHTCLPGPGQAQTAQDPQQALVLQTTKPPALERLLGGESPSGT